jgi:carboxylesterase
MEHNKNTGCLLIHGFGGSIAEIYPLASRLTEAGYDVVCPKLKGHTGIRRDLKRVRYTDWIASAEEELLELKHRCRRVFLIGFSMGGLIAINLAQKYGAAGLVTINTPIYYWDVRRIASNIVMGLTGNNFRVIRRYLRATVAFPASALINFNLLLKRTKPMVKDICCPIFIAQGLDDDTVKNISAHYLADNVSSSVKELRFYENSGHQMLWSPASDEVIAHIRAFIKKIDKGSERRASRTRD